MSNKEKANQLVELTHHYETGLVYQHTDRVLYENLIEMAEWKDKEFKKVLLDIAIKFAKTAEDIKPLLNEFEELLKENHDQ